MNRTTILAGTILALVFSSRQAEAQGLVGVGQNMETHEDFEGDLPLTYTIRGGAGWDSNSNTATSAEADSVYGYGGVGALYGAGNRTTQVNIGGDFSVYHYFDSAPGFDDEYYNGRLSLDVVHRATPRLTIVDDASFSYEFEPDYLIGVSTSRRTSQYYYYYNRAAAAYAWSRRVSTVTAYTFNGIEYDSIAAGFTEDRLTHIFSNQLRYAMSRQTTLTAEYRLQLTDFDHISRDIDSHFIMAGIDHYFSRTASGTIAAGAQFYDDEVSGSDSAPYVEGALNVAIAEETTLRWANRLGYETNELAGFNSRYTYRTGVSAEHRFTPYLKGIAGLSYADSEFESPPPGPDISEEAVGVNLGLSLKVSDNTDVGLNYYFTDYSSDTPLRNYDRHRVSLGFVSTF